MLLNCGAGEDSWESLGLQFFGSNTRTPILWPPDGKTQIIGKDPNSGKDWRQEEKEMTEDEMFGWHHGLDGLEFEQAPRVGDGQGSLACYSPWGYRVGQAEWLNWDEVDCKKNKPVNYKGNKSWIFTGGTDSETKVLILQPPNAKNCLIGKDPDAEKDWRQGEKGVIEGEMVEWNH